MNELTKSFLAYRKKPKTEKPPATSAIPPHQGEELPFLGWASNQETRSQRMDRLFALREQGYVLADGDAIFLHRSGYSVKQTIFGKNHGGSIEDRAKKWEYIAKARFAGTQRILGGFQ